MSHHLLRPTSTFTQYRGAGNGTAEKRSVSLAPPLHNIPDLPPPRNTHVPSNKGSGMAEGVGKSHKSQATESDLLMVVSIRHSVLGGIGRLDQAQHLQKLLSNRIRNVTPIQGGHNRSGPAAS